MLHDLFTFWFHLLESWGYAGVFFLMALESSIFPVPSEIVMPPAAFWTTQGTMTFWGVVLTGTLGSYFGSLVSYLLSWWIGMPLLERYGKYVLLPPKKLALAHSWIERFGFFGIFTARLLPVVRHLVSIPAGALRMPFVSFSVATIIGAGIWCWVLAWFGQDVLGKNPELLDSPEALIKVMHEKLFWFVGAVAILALLYGLVVWFKISNAKKHK